MRRRASTLPVCALYCLLSLLACSAAGRAIFGLVGFRGAAGGPRGREPGAAVRERQASQGVLDGKRRYRSGAAAATAGADAGAAD